MSPSGFATRRSLLTNTLIPKVHNSIDAGSIGSAILEAVATKGGYELLITFFEDSSCAIPSSVRTVNVTGGNWCSPLGGSQKLLTAYQTNPPLYHGIVMNVFVNANAYYGGSSSPSGGIPGPNDPMQKTISTVMQTPLQICQPYSNSFTPQFHSAILVKCWTLTDEIHAQMRFYSLVGCKGKSVLQSIVVGPTYAQYDFASKTSFYLACL